MMGVELDVEEKRASLSDICPACRGEGAMSYEVEPLYATREETGTVAHTRRITCRDCGGTGHKPDPEDEPLWDNNGWSFLC